MEEQNPKPRTEKPRKKRKSTAQRELDSKLYDNGVYHPYSRGGQSLEEFLNVVSTTKDYQGFGDSWLSAYKTFLRQWLDVDYIGTATFSRTLYSLDTYLKVPEGALLEKKALKKELETSLNLPADVSLKNLGYIVVRTIFGLSEKEEARESATKVCLHKEESGFKPSVIELPYKPPEHLLLGTNDKDKLIVQHYETVNQWYKLLKSKWRTKE